MLALVKTSTHTGPLTIKDQNQKDQKDFLDLRLIYFVIFTVKNLLTSNSTLYQCFSFLYQCAKKKKEAKNVKILTLAQQRI